MGILRRLQIDVIDLIDATRPDRRFFRAAQEKRQDQAVRRQSSVAR
jgi:hypothetical protein